MVKYSEEVTELHPILFSVPQWSVLGPIIYQLHTADLFETPQPARFLDFPLTHSRMPTTIQKFGGELRLTSLSQHVTFALWKETCLLCTSKFTFLIEDSWKEHISRKRKQLTLKVSKLYWLIGNKCKLSLKNKLTIYKMIVKPVWAYGVQLWGTAGASNISKLQIFIHNITNNCRRTVVYQQWSKTPSTRMLNAFGGSNIPLIY